MIRLEVVGFVGEFWHWRAVGANGKILCSSEVYSSKSNARRAVRKFAEHMLPFHVEVGDDIEIEVPV